MRVFCSVSEGVGVNIIGGYKEYNGKCRSVGECCRNIVRVCMGGIQWRGSREYDGERWTL